MKIVFELQDLLSGQYFLNNDEDGTTDIVKFQPDVVDVFDIEDFGEDRKLFFNVLIWNQWAC